MIVYDEYSVRDDLFPLICYSFDKDDGLLGVCHFNFSKDYTYTFHDLVSYDVDLFEDLGSVYVDSFFGDKYREILNKDKVYEEI